MKVDDLLQHAADYIGKSIELEGYLIVALDDDKYIPYLSSSDTLKDNINIYIEQPLAEIRKIIQPMHTMILAHRGEMTKAPYLYNFPLHLTAEVDGIADGIPILQRIESVRLYIEYPATLAQSAGQKRYGYTATVDYTPTPTAKATISAQKVLRFSDAEDESHLLDPDENVYARRIIGQKVTIPGWLKYLPTVNGHPNFVLRTFALRASMVGIGPLRGMTSIWWRPAEQYKVVRAHMPLAADAPDTARRVDITGQIDYLNNETPPFTSETQPQLVFTQVDSITVHHEDSLRAVIHDPEEDAPP